MTLAVAVDLKVTLAVNLKVTLAVNLKVTLAVAVNLKVPCSWLTSYLKFFTNCVSRSAHLMGTGNLKI